MFCPTCGKENSAEIKFCASCGTNLEAVSHALTGTEEDFFTRIDGGIDHFLVRYSEHVFTNTKTGSSENGVAKSWRLLGQGVVTSFLDLILFILMWNFLPLRFLLLLISTPFRLLSQGSKDQQSNEALAAGYKPPELGEPAPRHFLSDTMPSVTEDTTVNLRVSARTKEETAPIPDKLK